MLFKYLIAASLDDNLLSPTLISPGRNILVNCFFKGLVIFLTPLVSITLNGLIAVNPSVTPSTKSEATPT